MYLQSPPQSPQFLYAQYPSVTRTNPVDIPAGVVVVGAFALMALAIYYSQRH